MSGPTVSLRFLSWLLLLAVSALVAGSHEPPGGSPERLAWLRTELARHDELYYRQAAPEISDAEYDRLKQELAALAPDADLPSGDSSLGDDRTGRFPLQRHGIRMLSLDKVYTERAWRDFHARVLAKLGRPAACFVVEPKYDGVAVSFVYEHGTLQRAVTRGNGWEGDDVTANVRRMAAIPLELRRLDPAGAANPIPERVELRGEVYVEWDEFDRLNATPEAAGAPFSHPRNLAAGTLRSLDPAVLAARQLAIAIHGWGEWIGAGEPATQQAFHRQVAAWGLPAVAAWRVADTSDACWQAVTALGRERAGLGFPSDGVVVKLDDVAGRAALGAGESAPRWAIACKFSAERAVARVRAITVQVGRTGVLTPVAEFEPVELGGAWVARATLHNRAEIARRDVRVGDFVEVERAGEIIPAVVAVQAGRRAANTGAFVFPSRCPSCGAAVASSPDEVVVRCPNRACPAQRQRRLEHFASRAAVGLDGFGPATIATLGAAGLLRSPVDFFRLDPGHLESLLGEAGARRLQAGIARGRRAELWRIVHGCSVPHIGAVTARKLAAICPDLEAFARLSAAELSGVVGPVAAESVEEFLADPDNQALLEALAAEMQPAATLPRANAALAGKVVVFTGTLPGLRRAEAAAWVRAAGGVVRERIGADTDYLVVGTDPGRKREEAERAGVRILDAEEFAQLIRP